MSFLTKEYPFGKRAHEIRDSLVWGIVIFVLLYVLQPFGFSSYGGNKLLVSLVFGFVTFICCLVYGWVVFRTMRKRETVKVWHVAVATSGVVLLNGGVNWLCFLYIFHCPVTIGYFLQFLYWAFIFGGIITAISLYTSYNSYLKKQIEVLRNERAGVMEEATITIQDQNVRGSDLMISLNALLYVEAKKNDVTVCYTEAGKVKYRDVHATLSSVLETLQEYQNIFRCHRSFLVNLNHVVSAKGNSNGYKLTMRECTENIPVSRSYSAELKQRLA